MARVAVLVLLSLLWQDSSPPSHETLAPSANPDSTAAQSKAGQDKDKARLIPNDIAKIIVFPTCGRYADDNGHLRLCPIEAIYELSRPLSEGHVDIFDKGEVSDQYPLPDLSAGRHTLELSRDYYWSSDRETFPEPMLTCFVGQGPIQIMGEHLWELGYAGDSPYDYKPAPPNKDDKDKDNEQPYDPAAEFRGDDVGLTTFNIPLRRNLKLRESGDLPEIEILGVGFVEGTLAECGQSAGEKTYTSPVRDVRVVSTVSHDADPDIPVLKAAKFTVPREVFMYPRHIQIVGRVK